MQKGSVHVHIHMHDYALELLTAIITTIFLNGYFPVRTGSQNCSCLDGIHTLLKMRVYKGCSPLQILKGIIHPKIRGYLCFLH